MDELTQVSVGADRFRAHVIAEACRAAGLEVELLMSDDTHFFVEIRLLVRTADLERVAALIQKADGEDRP